MAAANLSLTGLRVLAAVAERGSVTAAARALGYTQSAVSRQVAALEREVGQPLFTRSAAGVVLTAAGDRVLVAATRILAELDATQRALDGEPVALGPVRLGAFTSAIAALVPAALSSLGASHPALRVTLREGTTPALVRALRAGTIDLAVLAAVPPFRPYDADEPPLDLEVVAESSLPIAVGPGHRFAARASVDVAELEHERWVASRPDGTAETLLGVWPGAPGRPDIAYTVRDWQAKAALVTAGLGITSWPRIAAPAAPPGVHLVDVTGGAHERRRTVLARRPGPPSAAVDLVAAALRDAAAA